MYRHAHFSQCFHEGKANDADQTIVFIALSQEHLCSAFAYHLPLALIWISAS